MLKALLFIAVMCLVLWYFFKKKPGHKTPPPAAAIPENMVSCAYCRLNIPAGEAIQSGGRHFCSEEHRRLAR